MVNMGMSQKHKTDLGRIKSEIAIVMFLDRLAALEHTAVDQKTAAIMLQQIAGTGHSPRRAAKSHLHCHIASSC